MDVLAVSPVGRWTDSGMTDRVVQYLVWTGTVVSSWRFSSDSVLGPQNVLYGGVAAKGGHKEAKTPV